MPSPTWTELWSSFTPAGTGWQNYDIFTNLSVPKGAIAHIVMYHTNTGSVRTVGVRTDGSSLSRYCILNVAGTGGGLTLDMYVKCDLSTGLIETYCDSTTGVTFYCSGYWTGIDYTEAYTDITGTLTANTWVSRDIYTNQSVPKGSVCSVVAIDKGTASQGGVRTGGSSLSRYITMPTCSGGSGSGEATVFQAISNASTGEIQLYMGATTTLQYILTGYFDSSMGYTELGMVDIGSSASWLDDDITANLDVDGRIVDVGTSHYDTAAAHTLGMRINGSSLSRYVIIKPAVDGYVTLSAPTGTNSSGILQMYNSPDASGYHYISGYYIPLTSLGDYEVAFTSVTNAIEEAGQRKVFLNQSMYWIIYSDGSNMCISSSSDKITWSNKTTVKSGLTDSKSFAGCLNGNYLEVAYVLSDSLYYNKITLNSDGTITLGTERTVLAADSTNKYAYPSITIDSNGKAIIGYRLSATSLGTQTTAVFSPSSGSGWTSSTNIYTNNATRSSTSTANAYLTASGYGITDPTSGSAISKVEIGFDGYKSNTNHYVQLSASWNNGTNYTTAVNFTPPTGSTLEALTYTDCTNGRSWTWSELANGSFIARARYIESTSTSSSIYCDWLPVRITYAPYVYSNTPCVVKNNSTDGTWSTVSGFPYQLNTTDDTDWRVYPQSITSGKLIAIYGGDSSYLYAKGYDGSSTWGSEASTNTNTLGGYTLSIVPGNAEDVVYIAFKTLTTNYGKFLSFNYSTNAFGTVESIDASAAMAYLTLSRVNSDFYVFYVNSGVLYYKKRAGGTWDSTATTWQSSINEALGVQSVITGSTELVVIYGTGSSSYTINDKVLSLSVAAKPFSFCVFVG